MDLNTEILLARKKEVEDAAKGVKKTAKKVRKAAKPRVQDSSNSAEPKETQLDGLDN